MNNKNKMNKENNKYEPEWNIVSIEDKVVVIDQLTFLLHVCLYLHLYFCLHVHLMTSDQPSTNQRAGPACRHTQERKPNKMYFIHYFINVLVQWWCHGDAVTQARWQVSRWWAGPAAARLLCADRARAQTRWSVRVRPEDMHSVKQQQQKKTFILFFVGFWPPEVKRGGLTLWRLSEFRTLLEPGLEESSAGGLVSVLVSWTDLLQNTQWVHTHTHTHTHTV